MDLFFDFKKFFFFYPKMKLEIHATEFYCKLKVNFKTKNDGGSFLSFIDSPFVKAKANIDFKYFGFSFSINDRFSFFQDFLNSNFIFDEIIYPERVKIPIILT